MRPKRCWSLCPVPGVTIEAALGEGPLTRNGLVKASNHIFYERTTLERNRQWILRLIGHPFDSRRPFLHQSAR